MADTPPFERRKNVSRAKAIDVTFKIVWNATRRTFDIQRNAASTASFAQDRETAVGVAVREAQVESADGKNVAVYSSLHGKDRTEWTSWSR